MTVEHDDRNGACRCRSWGWWTAGALLLLVGNAAALWLAGRLASACPVPLQALLGAGLVGLLGLPVLGYAWARAPGGGNPHERLRAEAIVRHAAEGILTVSKRGLILSLNPEAEQLFGYRAGEVVHRPITLLLDEAPAYERRNPLRDTLPAGTILGLAAGAREVLGKRKGGETFPLELTGSSMMLGDEPVSVAFVRDVSKRKRAQRYLTAHYAAACTLAEAGSLAEALPRILQAVCEALGWEAGAYWQFDRAAGVLRCAERHPAGEGNPPGVAAEGLRCAPGQGLAGRVWSTGKPAWVDELGGSTDDPSLSWAGSLPVQGAFGFPVVLDGQVEGALTFASVRPLKRDRQLQDIMAELGKQLGQFIARKRAEERLRDTTQTLQAVVQASPVAISISDLDGNVRLWNPAAERIFGWAEANVLGRSLPLRRVESNDAAGESALLLLERRSAHSEPIRCRRKDNTVIEVSLSTAPLRDSAGTVFGVLALMMDLTGQKELEGQLRQAQKMEAMGQLAGGVAHDFNNLLTIILGYSEILLKKLDFGEMPPQELLEQIQKAGKRAAALTRQLLAFGRKQTLQVQVLDVNTVVQELGKMLCRLIGEDIELVFRLDPLLGRIKADPSQIDQILLNLVANARDAMPQGGTLTITTANVELDKSHVGLAADVAPGPYVLLAVKDTGCGMSEVTKARVFEPFYTTKEIGKGTGLGLATVYGIVKQSNGHIELESQAGHGSTFRIYLPRLEEVDLDFRDPKVPLDMPPGKETILLVEDEADVREVVNHTLQLNGYTVLQARTGQEALDLCQEPGRMIDLLVTDVIMPQMNGRQVAEQATSLRKNLKVLYISGYTDRVLGDQGILAPGTLYLQKPISPRLLAQKVREVLDARLPA